MKFLPLTSRHIILYNVPVKPLTDALLAANAVDTRYVNGVPVLFAQ